MFKNKISRFSKYSAAAGTLALCGCTMIPDYENPDETYGRGKLDAPEFKHAAGLWKNAAPSDGAPKGEWWAIFGDAKLDALIKACDANNPDIAAAEGNVRSGGSDRRAQIDGAEFSSKQIFQPNIGRIGSCCRFRPFFCRISQMKMCGKGKINNRFANLSQIYRKFSAHRQR